MLFFLVTCSTLSFILFLNSLPLKHLSFSSSPLCNFIQKGFIVSMKQDSISNSKFELNGQFTPLLDLPELALDCILEKLSPTALRTMSGVSSSLRDRCVSDHLWEKHMKHKWGHVLSPAAFREWKCFVASEEALSNSAWKKSQWFLKYFWHLCPLSSIRVAGKLDKPSPRVDSVMSRFSALESGKFWFPAQVYNRENSHVGFTLSCYDAELSYDSENDTFHARYVPHGIRDVVVESGVQWERVRVAPVTTSPQELHVSDCLGDLHPGDHVEIQWRRNKEFPYGWWYGVIGHLETCDGNENYCNCCNSDTVVLEFKQHTRGSRWRNTNIRRKDHREEGNESDGFYGGIRKLYKNDEIATWNKFWPTEILEQTS